MRESKRWKEEERKKEKNYVQVVRDDEDKKDC